MNGFTKREKLILAGLFLSKFDDDGLRLMGFRGFFEAFNTLALSIKAKPASLKNYRDEFDPYFPNPRKGWHKRKIREYCKIIMDEYGGMNIEDLANLIKTAFSTAGDLTLIEESIQQPEETSFAKRMVTGQAAENYFEDVYPTLSPFKNYTLVNTTAFGCGFDYKMVSDSRPFLAVEVKGITATSGAVQLTSKEHKVAELFSDRYFLFVVRNFAEKPFHTLFQNPLESNLVFERRETVAVQISWSTIIGENNKELK